MKLMLKDLPQQGRQNIIPINASGLKIASCQRRWFMTVVLGLKEKNEDPILTVGKIVHRFAEAVAFDRSEENLMKATVEALGVAKAKGLGVKETTQVREALGSCPVAELPKPLVLDNIKGAEFKFTFPIPNYPSFVYTGTIDLITHDGRQNKLVIFDYKTSRKYLFKDIIAGYTGDTQFTFYPWVVHKFAYELFKGHMEYANLGWYRHLAMVPLVIMLSGKPVSWRKGPEQTFTEERFAMFEHLLEDFINIIEPYIEDEQLPPPTGMINNSCPSCPFKGICYATSSAQLEIELGAFDVVTYEPLKW